MTERSAMGRLAEDRAIAFLASRGYSLLVRNYRTRRGEIDIAAELDGCIAIVEVKARKSTEYGYPREAVSRAKQKRVVLAAGAFLASRGLYEANVRFDVIEVYDRKVVHWKNAFEAAGA